MARRLTAAPPQKLEEQDRRALSIKEQLQREHRFLKRRLEQLSVQSLERVRTDSTGSAVSTDDSEQGGHARAARRVLGLGRCSPQPRGGQLGRWAWPGRRPGGGVGMTARAASSRSPRDSVSPALPESPLRGDRSHGVSWGRHRPGDLRTRGPELGSVGQCALGATDQEPHLPAPLLPEPLLPPWRAETPQI